ncbi:MAG: hypothetical protein K1X53_08900, partial [Candidatus Sumerlaeaceae bacterium]|nr:hypothetical protein [Candidatus Sumerlaeaceae bacterium]
RGRLDGRANIGLFVAGRYENREFTPHGFAETLPLKPLNQTENARDASGKGAGHGTPFALRCCFPTPIGRRQNDETKHSHTDNRQISREPSTGEIFQAANWSGRGRFCIDLRIVAFA